jgi:transposase
VTDRGHPAAEVAERLGVSIHSIYAWTKHYNIPEDERKAQGAGRSGRRSTTSEGRAQARHRGA